MRNKSGNRWNADHIPVSMSFQCHQQILTATKTRIHTCMQNAKASTQSWLTRPPLALPDAKRWTCNETLIHLSSPHKARTPHWPPLQQPLWSNTRLLPKTRGPHEYSCCQHCWRRNRIRWDQRWEIPIVQKHTSTLVLYSMHAWWWWWCCCSLSLYFSVFLWHPARPHTSKCRNARTCTDLNPPTCFHVYTVWLVSTVVHIFTFPSWGSFVQPSAQFVCHSSASVQRLSRLIFKCVRGFGLFVMNPYLDSCFSFTLLAYQPHTC